MRACPSCQREWPAERDTCPRCLASLVDDLDATITCPECGRACPSRMHSCPGCLALLRPNEVDLGPDLVRAISTGLRMHRPADRLPFAGGPSCTLLRLRPQAGLVLCGAEGLIEANLTGSGIRARPPLMCSADGATLFRLDVYDAADRALVAIGGHGAPLATYLRTGGPLSEQIEIRDETSAPVARLERSASCGLLRVVDTRGHDIGAAGREDVEQDGWVDDQWSVSTIGTDLPMKPLAFVALAVAAKCLLGRPAPVRLREPAERDRDDLEDTLGAIGKTIVDGFFT